MPSSIATQNKPLRIFRKKFVAADFAALTEKSIFGLDPAVATKGYGTIRFSAVGNDQAFTLKTYQRPEIDVAAGSTSYTFGQTSSQLVPASPTVPPTTVDVSADELDVTITPGAAVFTSLELEVTLQP